MEFYSRKIPKKGLLKSDEVIFKSGAILEQIQYINYWSLAYKVGKRVRLEKHSQDMKNWSIHLNIVIIHNTTCLLRKLIWTCDVVLAMLCLYSLYMTFEIFTLGGACCSIAVNQLIFVMVLRLRSESQRYWKKQKVGQDIQLSSFDCLLEFAVWNDTDWYFSFWEVNYKSFQMVL